MSPPSQRRRGQDSSNGDLMPMPTSPATDMLSPAAPQDTSLFSSPRASGSIHTVLVCFSLKTYFFKIFFSFLLRYTWVNSSVILFFFFFNIPAQWSGHELPTDVRDPQLQGWGDASQQRAWHSCQTAPWSGVSQEGAASRSSLWAGQWRSPEYSENYLDSIL